MQNDNFRSKNPLLDKIHFQPKIGVTFFFIGHFPHFWPVMNFFPNSLPRNSHSSHFSTQNNHFTQLFSEFGPNCHLTQFWHERTIFSPKKPIFGQNFPILPIFAIKLPFFFRGPRSGCRANSNWILNGSFCCSWRRFIPKYETNSTDSNKRRSS